MVARGIYLEEDQIIELGILKDFKFVILWKIMNNQI